jgi:ABC-type nitrate/sulfonate/bicarbonate transport system ATPase subunit
MNAFAVASEERVPGKSEPSDSVIAFDSVEFRYDNGVTALQDFSLEFPLRSRIAVVGPSGCGKTTLLHLLAGTRTAAKGSIKWPTSAMDVQSRSMVFQKDTLLPWLSVLDNVGLAFRLKGQRKKQYAARARELLNLVRLDEFTDAYPYELSGGMRRRVAFLAAIAPQPGLLLLDEPFSALDEPTRLEIHQDVLQILANSEMTLVLITHDLAEAITLCDEVAIMSGGPGRVMSRHSVPFPHDRDVYTLRREQKFLDLYATLWQELSDQLPKRERLGPIESLPSEDR